MESTAFDPTTLITFLFRAPAEARIVELLGSWDNFRQPYRMHHDRRRGLGIWSGCFKFENIVHEGESLRLTKPRSGGLKQGGTYWYYYRLDYDADVYDERQPHTTWCPLMPGQRVNIIDVPKEVVEPPERCHSAYGEVVGGLTDIAEKQTLDPSSKFATLAPPPKSKVHARCSSDDALDGRLENNPLAAVKELDAPTSPPHSRRRNLVSASSRASRRSRPYSRSVYSGHGAFDNAPTWTEAEVEHANNDAPTWAGAEDEHANDDAPTWTEAEDEHANDDAPTWTDAKDENTKMTSPYMNISNAGPLASLEVLSVALVTSSSAGDTRLDRHHHARGRSEISLGPASITNVQFYGSRPGTSLTEDPEQYRPRMYSLHNFANTEKTKPTKPASLTFNHSPEHDYHANGDDNLVSPTFSATTVSSGGQNTPFRLSIQNPITNGVYVPSGPERQTLGDIADRLQALDCNSSPDRNCSSRPTTAQRARTSLHSFMNYLLPTIGPKTKSASALPPPQQLPSVFQPGEGRSMAEDIFSELGYLGGSIA